MVFVGQKQQKFLEVTKSFERDFIFAQLHEFKKYQMGEYKQIEVSCRGIHIQSSKFMISVGN